MALPNTGMARVSNGSTFGIEIGLEIIRLWSHRSSVSDRGVLRNRVKVLLAAHIHCFPVLFYWP